MLAKARTVNGYENMSRQQLETIFTIPSIPKWTPKPTPWISIAIQQCQCKCGHMFWQLQHFGIVVPVVDTICFLCSHWYANSGCIVSSQMLHNNCCSLFTSFSPLFIYTQQLCSFYEFILPEDISFSCMCLACKSNNLEDLGGRGVTWQEWGGVFEGGFIPQCTLCYTFMWHSRAVNQHLNLLQSPKKHTLTAVTGTKPKKHRLNLS